MTTTTNYGLNKPAQTDNYNVDDFNKNADTIDEQLKANANAISNAEALKANKADLMSLLFTVVSVIDDDSSTT